MENMYLDDKIFNDITNSYLSINKPNYSFATKAYKENIYGNILKKIKYFFKIEDYTSLDDDVCFYYILKNIKFQYNIYLMISMVGRYGILSKNNILLCNENDVNTAEEKKIINILKSNNIILLWKSILKKEIKIKLLESEEDFHTYFEVLFTNNIFPDFLK